MGSGVSLLRVSVASIAIVDGPTGYPAEALTNDFKEACEYLARLTARLARPGRVLASDVRAGPVADTIVDYAREKQADLIVMSTHGRTGLSRWVYGSVTERVLRAAHCPTLVVRSHATPVGPL